MRKYKCNPFQEQEVDLDNPKTYEYLPNTITELRQIMLSEIGYSYCYMNFWHSDIFDNNIDSGQKNRVNLLIEDFTKNEKENYNNIMWYKEKIFLFQDEIENMC